MRGVEYVHLILTKNVPHFLILDIFKIIKE